MKEDIDLENLQNRYDDMLLLYNNKDYNQLLIKSKEFCKDYPKNILGFNVLALAYKNTGKIEKAKELYERLVEANSDNVSIYVNAGNLFYSLGNINKAIECHLKGLNIDSKNVGALNGLGLAYFNKGDVDSAIDYYTQVLEVDSTQTYANFNMANCLRQKKLNIEAATHYSKHFSKISQAQELECYYKLGDLKKFDEASKVFLERFGHTPLLATLSAHASVIYSRKDLLNFCPNPFDYIKKSNIFNDGHNQDLINNFVADFNNLGITKKEQSLLKNGFQSSGNIFMQEIESVQTIKKIIIEKIDEYKNKYLKVNPGLISDWPKNYTLYGWLILINNQGHLEPHVHKEGWLSGSLYINIPEKLSDDSGSIKFSLDGGIYPKKNHDFPEKIVNLETGDIVLFPSSIFHSTIPFSSKKNRITLAFDVRPKDLEEVR